MTMHDSAHPLAGQTVEVTLRGFNPDRVPPSGVLATEYRIEDWWDKLTGGSWMSAEGNPAALIYAARAGAAGLPVDNEVVYGKIGSAGYLVHVSELGAISK